MTTFALIHGASSAGFYWDRVVPRLERAGHVAVAPDLPTADRSANFIDYADAVEDALRRVSVADRDLVIVGHSMGAFTAPIVATRRPGARMILTAPMIPLPGETPAQYFQNVELQAAQESAAHSGGYDAAFDVRRTFLHDVDLDLVEQLMARGEPEQAESIFAAPFPLDSWPAAPTRVIACTEDRMFPQALIERVARDRLGIGVEQLRSGHLPGFSRPEQLAEIILRNTRPE